MTFKYLEAAILASSLLASESSAQQPVYRHEYHTQPPVIIIHHGHRPVERAVGYSAVGAARLVAGAFAPHPTVAITNTPVDPRTARITERALRGHVPYSVIIVPHTTIPAYATSPVIIGANPYQLPPPPLQQNYAPQQNYPPQPQVPIITAPYTAEPIPTPAPGPALNPPRNF